MQSFDSIEKYAYGTNKNFSLVFITQSYVAVLKKYWTKFYSLFHYENPKQTRPSTKCIQSFIKH